MDELWKYKWWKSFTKRPRNIWFHLNKLSRRDNFVAKEGRSVVNVYLRNRDTYQEVFLMTNWAQIKRKSLAAISKQRPLTQTALQGQAYTELPACLVFLTSEPVLIKESLELYFNQWDWSFSGAVQLYPYQHFH